MWIKSKEAELGENTLKRKNAARRMLLCILSVMLIWCQYNESGRKIRAADISADNQTETVSTGEEGKSEEDFPSYWYAGDSGKKPTVRSQGKYGTCWALTAVSALETALLPDSRIQFSADHMALNNSFEVPLDEGGDYYMTMAYLSSWQGPVTEDEDPYGDEYSPENLSPAVHVQEMQLLCNPDLDEIKEAVRRYGSVQTSLYMDRGTASDESIYYKEETEGYYYPDEKTASHDILILGWNDKFPKEWFQQVPPGDGAFICQNSWGDEFGREGIFFVSYWDANIGETALVYSRVEAADNYDGIYQTDTCGWQGVQGYAQESCWFANVYTAERQEELTAVGFYATGSDTSYELFLVHDFETPDSFEHMEFLHAGNMENAGYYTVDLDKPAELEAGERFAVVVRIVTPETENPVAVEYRADEYTQNVVTDGKEGYLSQYGKKWQHTEESFGTNVCLKAYVNR